jgi:hypothetical protein
MKFVANFTFTHSQQVCIAHGQKIQNKFDALTLENLKVENFEHLKAVSDIRVLRSSGILYFFGVSKFHFLFL